jgi:DNA-binding GntR family transcriptional regulator
MDVTREPTLVKSKDCMSDRIKGVIMQRIASGDYAPGQRLVELQIAKEFETSQSPVREALCELEAMRIVETEPYKGTRVREITPVEWQECLAIRGSLEQLAAETIGDRLQSKIPLLQKFALETMDAAKERDIDRYRRANLEFHRTIIDACENQTLISVWYSLAPEIRMLVGVQANVNHLIESAEEHLEVVDALKEGDNRYAGRLLKKHTEKVLVHTQSLSA